MSGEPLAIVADGLVVLGVLGTTLGVYGLYRMPDVYTRLHAASKAAYLGLLVLLLTALTARDLEMIAKSALVAAFLVLTAPVGSHALARAAYRRHEPPCGGVTTGEPGGEHQRTDGADLREDGLPD